MLRLFDKRRLGRVRLDPDIDALGPDGLEITPAVFRDRAELDALQRALRSSLKSAISHGGVHTGRFIGHRHAGGTCPRCGSALLHGTVGGRSTWWCPQDQPG